MESTGEWGRALTLIQGELPGSDVESMVVRVEARGNGRQVWALNGSDGTLWFLYEDGDLRRAIPTEDRKLPGSACLFEGELLAWRPGRRAVVADPGGGSIWKLFRAKRLKDAVERHQLAFGGCGEGSHWRVPAILHVDHKAARIQFERDPGLALPVQRAHASMWRRVGRGLAEFQQALDVGALVRHGRREELDIIVQLHQRYAALFGTRLAGVDELLERLEASVASEASHASFVAVHRDLHDGQFLVSGDEVAVLDFDQLCAGEPEVDLANLSAHFVLRQLQSEEAPGETLGDADVGECALALLSGFGIDGDEATVTALRFYQAATFTRLTVLYSLRPKWRHLRSALMNHARASLDEVCRA